MGSSCLVTSVVQDRCNRVGMNVRHMVDLGIGLHGDFPVAVQIEYVAGRQAAVFELELTPLVGNGSEPVEERWRVLIEIHEDQIAEAFAAHGDQTAAGKVQTGKVFRVADGNQIAIQ